MLKLKRLFYWIKNKIRPRVFTLQDLETWVCKACHPTAKPVAWFYEYSPFVYLTEEDKHFKLVIANDQGHDDQVLVSWERRLEPDPFLNLTDEEINNLSKEEFTIRSKWDYDTPRLDTISWPEDSERFLKVCRKAGWKNKHEGLVFWIKNRCAELLREA